jgi:MoaA/NifB/PqqE/SkfB family radical SAM enzyme
MSNSIGFHIEPTNICTLKCPGCERTRFISQWRQHWKNHSVDVDALMNFLDGDLLNVPVMLCGNTGDPIYHPEFHQLVKLLKARGAILKIVTNGSYKTQSWWTELCDLLDANDCIIFSIDGLPSNFKEYRINGDWDSIQVGINVAVSSNCQTVWKYIPFKYNQDNIDQARELSCNLGIGQFEITPSDRFDQQTLHYKPSDIFLNSRFDSQTNWKQTHSNAVEPECKNNKMHYISANGYYLPCCYAGDYRFYYKTEFWKSKEQFNIVNTTFTQLLNNSTLLQFTQTLDQQAVCQYNCPKTHEQ